MSGPDGPTGVIVLKKIADDTYEQYGSITLSETSLTQVTASQTVLATIFKFNPETQMLWRENFHSRLSQSQNNGASKGWPSGSWGTQGPGNGVMARFATVSGAVRLQAATGSAASAVFMQLDINSGGGTGRTLSHLNRNPTWYMRWAQAGTAVSGVRAIGWQWVDGDRLDTTAFGLFFRHAFNGAIDCVSHNNAVETSVTSAVTAANGVYHTGRIVITGGGTAAQFFLDGVAITTLTTNLPAGAPGVGNLKPTACQSLGVGISMDVDYMALIQSRTA